LSSYIVCVVYNAVKPLRQVQSWTVLLLRCEVLFAGHCALTPSEQKKSSPHSRHSVSYRKKPGRHVQSELAAEPAGELLCSVHPSLRPWPGQKKFAAQGAHPEGVDRSKPGAHRQCSGSVAAGGDCVCAGHSEQTCCPLPLLYLPGAHAVQGADDDVKSEVLLSGAYPASHSQGEPGAPVTLCSGHARHAFCWASWPGGQGTQELLPTKDLYVLAGHGAHAEVEPSAAGACPSAHKHSLASTAPAKLVVGPGQAVQA